MAVLQYLEEDITEGRCVRSQDLQEKALELLVADTCTAVKGGGA